MGEPIENLYFNWLYEKVYTDHLQSKVNRELLVELHKTQFVWLVSGDDNRAEEGIELRREFSHASFIKLDPYWMKEPCSVLEMLVAFSRRAAFEAGKTPAYWFWYMLDNLNLIGVRDKQIIHDTINTFIWRTYDANGYGGLFPLDDPQVNQRDLELWYQFNEFVYERLHI